MTMPGETHTYSIFGSSMAYMPRMLDHTCPILSPTSNLFNVSRARFCDGVGIFCGCSGGNERMAVTSVRRWHSVLPWFQSMYDSSRFYHENKAYMIANYSGMYGSWLLSKYFAKANSIQCVNSIPPKTTLIAYRAH
jgi:hypothetical protein